MVDGEHREKAERSARRWQALGGWVMSNRGLIYFATRYGSIRWRRLAFEGNYRRGRWDLADDAVPPGLPELVRRHRGAGRLLELGCGTGRLAAAIPPETWTSYTGVDLAPSAIDRARARELPRAIFVEDDFETGLPGGLFDLIICEESLYYIAANRQPDFLARVGQRLAPDGKLLVTLVDPRRFAGLSRLLRERFDVVENGRFAGKRQEYLVLQHKACS